MFLVNAASCRNEREDPYCTQSRDEALGPLSCAAKSVLTDRGLKAKARGWRRQGLRAGGGPRLPFQPVTHHQPTQGCCCLLPIEAAIAPFSLQAPGVCRAGGVGEGGGGGGCDSIF